MIDRRTTRHFPSMTMPFAVRVPVALVVVLAALPACSGDDGGAEEASESSSSSEEESSSEESSSSTESESSSTESSSTESSGEESTGSESATESSSETGTGSETAGNVCEVAGWDAGPEAEQCAIFVTCEVEMDHQVNCSADGCICLADGANVGSCGDPASVCASPDDTALLAACCGWPF